MLKIALQSEYIASLGGILITNSFFTSLLVSLALCLWGLFFRNNQESKNILSNTMRVFVYKLLRFTDKATNNRQLSKQILPLIATFFLFIVGANLLALTPGFLGSVFLSTPTGRVSLLRSPNSDITTTLALALFSVFAIQFFSVRKLGWKTYLSKFFNFSSPLRFIIGFFELISEGIKILSFSFRLFGNIFAGEVLLLAIAFITPYFIPVPFMLLEVFVGVIQAFVFAVLTLAFIKTSFSNLA